uniref:Cold shock domain-containing protein C2 n=1 Tax=Caligus rogercresseyi TaxID=217165 RepID=C1BN53_CALRO|nr:Cold shock domain-containing protein C2 [Caligus rogercresseyi]ACO11708.1 Cold shock domain-containing protein C2 [Caligus rogercresseyi]|eukprot:TRINITY_DN883_c0_g1_i1.p1 TRINITY_DN883_c0_g1~~TRINITY_DN883_c0_g1_i1.p1  ORF type:complete len:190 (+),score=70.50 TRINITY_DN883_c0_g1_i1:174-743(+)
MESVVSSTTRESEDESSKLSPLSPERSASHHLMKIPAIRRTRCDSCSENGLSSTTLLSEALDPPETFVTRRTRTESTSGKTTENLVEGTVKYFCRSRGFGFLTPNKPVNGNKEFFMHISDIEGEFVPRRNDTVQFKVCPIPPRFEKFQAVQVRITNFTPEVHHKWDVPETPEELQEEEEAVSSAPHYDV